MNGYDEDYIEDGWSCEDAAARHDAAQLDGHATEVHDDEVAYNAQFAKASVAVTISEDEEPF